MQDYDSERGERVRFHRLLSICFAAYCVYTLIHYVGGHPKAVAIHAVGAVFTGAVWALGTFSSRYLRLAGHLNLLVSTLVLLAHAWNGAMKNDAAWFVVLVPLFAAYQLGWKAAVAWTVAPTFALVVLPIIAIDFKPSAEWLLTQQEIDRNRVLLLWLVSILAVASARSLRLEIVKTVQQKEQIEEFNARLNEANGTLAQRNADIQLFPQPHLMI